MQVMVMADVDVNKLPDAKVKVGTFETSHSKHVYGIQEGPQGCAN